MHVYITAGTLDFLAKIPKKHPSETIITMAGTNGSLLYHETNGKTVFQVPRRYELLESTGVIGTEGFVALNHIPVTDEGRPLLEHQVKNQLGGIEGEQGLIALRFLRPVSSNAYVLMTVWRNEASFDKWEKSLSYSKLISTEAMLQGGSSKLFDSSPYTSKYFITE